MSRRTIATALCAFILASASSSLAADAIGVVALQPAAARALRTATGVITINAVLAANAQLPDGANVSYSASVSVVDASFTNNRLISGSTTVAARKVTLSIRIPYIWLMAAMTGQMNISLFAAGNASTTGGPRYSFTTTLRSTVAVPPNGTPTPINFTGAL